MDKDESKKDPQRNTREALPSNTVYDERKLHENAYDGSNVVRVVQQLSPQNREVGEQESQSPQQGQGTQASEESSDSGDQSPD